MFSISLNWINDLVSLINRPKRHCTSPIRYTKAIYRSLSPKEIHPIYIADVGSSITKPYKYLIFRWNLCFRAAWMGHATISNNIVISQLIYQRGFKFFLLIYLRSEIDYVLNPYVHTKSDENIFNIFAGKLKLVLWI